jgi:hypothetical protein
MCFSFKILASAPTRTLIASQLRQSGRRYHFSPFNFNFKRIINISVDYSGRYIEAKQKRQYNMSERPPLLDSKYILIFFFF